MNANSYITESIVNQSQRFVLYKAKRRSDERDVVIKTPVPGALSDPALARSLQSEAEAAKRLSHHVIRKGYDHHESDSAPSFVCEYIAGKSLAEYLLEQKGKEGLQQSLIWARDLLHALIHAEKCEIQHSNLNPYNILIDEDKKLYVIGFGKEREAWKHSEGNPRYHFPLLYVAPETYRGSIIKENSDIYSWAVVLYQMLCGQLPWQLDVFSSPEEHKEQSLARGIILPDSILVPDWLYSVLLSCLNPDPEKRVASYEDLLELLRQESEDFDWDWQPEEQVVAETEEPVEAEPEELVEESVAEPIKEAVEETIEEPFEAIVQALEEEPIKIEEEEIEPLAVESVEPEEMQAEPELVAEEIAEPPMPEDEPISEPEPIEPVVPEPVAAEVPAPLPPKPQEKQPDYGYQIPKHDEKESQAKDIKNMRKTFVVLMLISLVIVAILGVQHLLEKKKDIAHKPDDSQIDLEVVIDKGVQNKQLPMIVVPADTLVMGSISPEADDDEFPLLTVKVPAFMIMPTELTQAQWAMVNRENPSLFKGDYLPVENVSFYDVVEYCNAKSALDGFTPAYDYHGSEIICNFDADGYRLPTEAEWELAAKGGQGKESLRYSGSEDALQVGWFAENSEGQSHSVRGKKANELGIYDMSGNVAEWVWNWYSPYSRGYLDLYAGPYEGTDRVIRGGSWYHGGNMMRVSARSYVKPYIKKSYIGFRLARSIR